MPRLSLVSMISRRCLSGSSPLRCLPPLFSCLRSPALSLVIGRLPSMWEHLSPWLQRCTTCTCVSIGWQSMQAQLSTITLIGTVIMHVFGYYGETNKNNVNAGTGKYGTCCTEIDIWGRTTFPLHSQCTPEMPRNKPAVTVPTRSTLRLPVLRLRAISCPWAS